jgi:hypothetical protein
MKRNFFSVFWSHFKEKEKPRYFSLIKGKVKGKITLLFQAKLLISV